MGDRQRRVEANAFAEQVLSPAGWTMASTTPEAPVPTRQMRELSMQQYATLMNESGATFDDAARALDRNDGNLVDTIVELTDGGWNSAEVLREREQRRERLRRTGSGILHVIERTRRLFPLPAPLLEEVGVLPAAPAPAPAPLPAPETEVVVEDAETFVPIAFPFQSFTAADGSTWTHTSERGWSREAAEEEPSVEERVAINEHTDTLEAWVVAQQARDNELLHQRERLNSDWRNGPVHVRNRIRFLLHESLVAHAEREAIIGRPVSLHEPWTDVLTAVRSWDGLPTTAYHVRRAIDQQDTRPLVGRQYYLDEVFETASGTEPESLPPPQARLASESSPSSSEDEVWVDEADTRSRARGGGYGVSATRRTRGFNAGQCRATVLHDAIKEHLRAVQEKLDAELAAAAQGTVFSEGSYVSIMESIKKAWEAVDAAHVTRV